MSRQLDSFLLNIHVSFSYITDDIFDKMKLEMDKYKGDQLNSYIYDTFNDVKNDLYIVNHATKKIKKLNFDFLNNITFLGLKFDVFKGENAKTKQVIVKYIFNMFNPIYTNRNPGNPLETTTVKSETGNPLENLLNNKQIMDLASEISGDIAQSNIDPMTMISSLLSGNNNPDFQKFIEKITTKIDSKMKNGELNREKLEGDSEAIIKSLGIDTTQPVDMSSITDLMAKFQT